MKKRLVTMSVLLIFQLKSYGDVTTYQTVYITSPIHETVQIISVSLLK